MNTGANEAQVLVSGATAATSGVVHLCVRCGGVLGISPDGKSPRSHELEQCVDELRRALFAAHKRIEELEADDG